MSIPRLAGLRGNVVGEKILNIVSPLSSLQEEPAEIAVDSVFGSDTTTDIKLVSVQYVFDGHKLNSVPAVNEISAATMRQLSNILDQIPHHTLQ
jgi:hypothetical protein